MGTRVALMRDDRQDIDRFFRCLVETLFDQSPERLRGAFQVEELYRTILPYRKHRTRLGVDSNQDYEMAVLRLLGGEGAYASVDPPEAAEALAAEAAEVNPDPGLVRVFADATIRLTPAAVDAVLGAEQSYAPPEPEPVEGSSERAAPVENSAGDEMAPTPAPVFALEEVEKPEPAAPGPRPSDGGAAICKSCGRGLPLNRPVTFCPFCGQNAHARACPTCGSALEAGWRHCVDCGAPAGRPTGSDS
jgi:predicted RNA-binding Zn-ribbon protein involved in translation (DUF1610 family)